MKNMKILLVWFVLLMVGSSAWAADEIVFGRESGGDYFVTIIRKDFQVWYDTGTTWETWGTSSRDLSDYGMEATEKQDTGIYTVTFGQAQSNASIVRVYVQAGDSPADMDDYDGGFSWKYLQVDVMAIGTDSQSATDLKDFADDGYDPGTDKVQGVVLVDTTTTNTEMASAADVVDEWESQSQADPTGFHVNLLEILGVSASSLLDMVTFNQNRTTSGKATGLITIYDTDDQTPIGTKVRDNTNSHYIYSEFKDVVSLAETPTATTWNVAGTIMTNGSATWDTGGVTLVEVGDIVEVISGTQAEAGEYVVQSVDSNTQITLEEGIADGGQPSSVTYIIKQAS
jgi:hypothetical protein